MNVGRTHGGFVRFLLTPVGRPTRSVAVVATILVFWWTAGLGFASWAMALGLLTWAGVYLYRLGRFVMRLVVATYYRQPFQKGPRYRFLLLITLSGLMIWTRLPLRVMFFLHRPAFDRVARFYYEQAPMHYPPAPPGWIGLYPVKSIGVFANGVEIRIWEGVRVLYLPHDSTYLYLREGDCAVINPPWYVSREPEAQILSNPVRRLANRIWP